jgi:hypothetical protein
VAVGELVGGWVVVGVGWVGGGEWVSRYAVVVAVGACVSDGRPVEEIHMMVVVIAAGSWLMVGGQE